MTIKTKGYAGLEAKGVLTPFDFERRDLRAEDVHQVLGAELVILSTDPEEMKLAMGSLDVILDTVPYQHDNKAYLPTLAPYRKFVIIGLLGFVETPVQT